MQTPQIRWICFVFDETQPSDPKQSDADVCRLYPLQSNLFSQTGSHSSSAVIHGVWRRSEGWQLINFPKKVQALVRLFTFAWCEIQNFCSNVKKKYSICDYLFKFKRCEQHGPRAQWRKWPKSAVPVSQSSPCCPLLDKKTGEQRWMKKPCRQTIWDVWMEESWINVRLILDFEKQLL